MRQILAISTLVLVAGGSATSGSSDTQPGAPTADKTAVVVGLNPDAPPETAQFAFLIGDWDCTTRFLRPGGGAYDEGRARWKAFVTLNGWAIQDYWIGYPADGGESHGTNIRSFNPRTGRWDNRWLAQGSLQWKHFEAEQVGDTMVMTGGEGKDSRGEFIDRNVFYDIEADSWRWRKDRSWDGGKTWLEGIGFIEATRREDATIGLVAATSHFAFHSNFWINLHHFVYRLASVSERTPVGEDQLKLVEKLSPADRALLEEAVRYYAERHVGNSLLRDDALFAFKRWAIEHDEHDTLSSMRFESQWLALLNAVKPVYARQFWPLHDARNRETITENLEVIAAIEEDAVRRLAALAQTPWPEGMVRVDVTYYANWAGAYTTTRPVTHAVISSADNQPRHWRELVFHESSHALIGGGWKPVGETLDEVAAARGIATPRQLWHGFLFYLVGRVVQEELKEQGIEQQLVMIEDGIFTRYHEALREYLEPYVQGEVELRVAAENIIDAVADSE